MTCLVPQFCFNVIDLATRGSTVTEGPARRSVSVEMLSVVVQIMYMDAHQPEEHFLQQFLFSYLSSFYRPMLSSCVCLSQAGIVPK